jgi:hypothetical protein
MYPGVLNLEFTDSEVLAASRRSGLLAAIAPEGGAPTERSQYLTVIILL